MVAPPTANPGAAADSGVTAGNTVATAAVTCGGGGQVMSPAAAPRSEIGIELGQRSSAVSLSEQPMAARISLRLCQPLATSKDGPSSAAAPSARVVPRKDLAKVLGLAHDMHVSYAEVEDALWALIKEHRLLEFSKMNTFRERDNQQVASVRLHAFPPLALALGIQPDSLCGVALPLTELVRN